MPRFAIVIGIDAYTPPAWRLNAAVDDAVRFARWAVADGGVEPANLRLLLSPPPATLDLPSQPADSRTIRATIHEFQQGAGAGGDRLYVYFAGHGLSAPGAVRGRELEPVLVPADVASIAVDGNLLLGFSDLITVLNGVDPPEQFFFIDACRDFELEDFQPGVGQGVGPWTPPRDDGATSRQFVLYATSPGQRAFEATSRGVFADELLDALSGRRPAASVWSANRYAVRFSTLATHVCDAVQERLQNVADQRRFVQLPQPLALRSVDAELASFTEAQMGTVSIRVRVGPSQARTSCRLRVNYAVPGVPDGVSLRETGPPAERSTRFEMPPGVYSLRAEAPGYEGYREPCDANVSRTVDISLTATGPPPASAAPAAPPGCGSLEVCCADPTALMVLRDAERAVRASGTSRLLVPDLPPGIYRVQLMTAEGAAADQLVEVTAGVQASLLLDAPGPRLGPDQQRMLADLGITQHNGYLHPSEHLDGFANASFASLLAFAAYAAHWPATGDFERLRGFGVPALTAIAPGRAGVMAIVGVSGVRPVPGVDRVSFLNQAEVVLRDLEGVTLDAGGLEVLSGMPAAAQRSTDIQPGSVIAELRLPGMAPTRYALAALPDRVTLLVAAAEDSGAVEVQQYLVPLRGLGSEFLLNDPKNIRRLDLAQRLYTRDPERPIDAAGGLAGRELLDLLNGKLMDPLLGALAGYSMVRTGRAAEYRAMAMSNMLTFFPGLPDSHVLAGLCEPERRDEHFGAAARLGLPVFADGFRALYEWSAATGGAERSLWTVPELLLLGSAWTAWVASRPALLVSDATLPDPPAGWQVLEARRAEVEQVLPAVGRLRQPDSAVPHTATAFLVAPGIAMTMAVAVGDGDVAGWVVDLADGPAGPAREFAVLERLATGGGTPAVAGSRFALLRLAPTTAYGEPLPEPVRLADRMPAPAHGRLVFVTGFPARDTRAPAGVLETVFSGVYGWKRVQPGQVLDVADEGFHHDCYTLGGNGGSPVVDLRSGLVLGFHHSGRWLEFKRGEATALWTAASRAPLAGLGARYEDPT